MAIEPGQRAGIPYKIGKDEQRNIKTGPRIRTGSRFIIFVCQRYGKKKKGMVLYSAVSSPLDRSKRFTLSSPGRPVHSDTVLGFSWKHSNCKMVSEEYMATFLLFVNRVNLQLIGSKFCA